MVRELTLFWLFFVQPGEIQWDACQVVVGRKPSEDTWAISLREDVSITFYHSLLLPSIHHRNISVHRALTSCHQVCSLQAQQWPWAARTVCTACVTGLTVGFEAFFFLFFFVSNICSVCVIFTYFPFPALSLVSLGRRFMWEKKEKLYLLSAISCCFGKQNWTDGFMLVTELMHVFF
jgi:hypothetical protein